MVQNTIQQVAVLGAGQMGRGIARACMMNGFKVILVDNNPEQIQETIEKINQRPAGADLKLLTTSTQLSDIQNSDLVIEAIIEIEEDKRAIYQEIIPFLKPSTIIASNSSSISITRLAAASDRADRFCGMHFMNPVSAMPLVELVRGLGTSDETFSLCEAFITALGKEIAEAEDFPGFIVNRVLVPMINEAIYALYEGVGNVSAIDRSLRLGASHPLGPLQLADFIGLDTVLAILSVLHNKLADNKYRPCPLLLKYVEAGWLGKKVGRGFYDYATDPPRPTR